MAGCEAHLQELPELFDRQPRITDNAAIVNAFTGLAGC
jgi:hypothetical protein